MGEALSSAVHESQSLLWERLVGLSLPFHERNWPKMKASLLLLFLIVVLFVFLFLVVIYVPIFQAAFKFPESMTAEEFYQAFNLAKPSYIRVESNELYYPLHVIVHCLSLSPSSWHPFCCH